MAKPGAGGGSSGPTVAEIRAYIERVAKAQGVPIGFALAVAFFESRFNESAVSPAGAIGVFQLMPATADGLGVNPRNWRENIEGGIKYLKGLHADDRNWHDTYAAYNYGPGNADDPTAQRNASEVMRLARRRFGDAGTGGGRGGGGGTGFGEDSAAKFIAVARKQLGDPYVWGAEGPNGFDCSGLVYFALNRAGVHVPRTTANGYMSSTPNVGRENLRAGDLVFFNYGRLPGGQADHVGIYVGNGQMIDASSSNDRMMLRSVDWDNYIGGGRIAGLSPSSQQQVNAAIKGTAGGGGGAGDGTPGWSDSGHDMTKRELRGILQGYGIAPDAFMPLITQAIQEQWSVAEFRAAVYDSKVFRQTFPGIFDQDGALKMTPAEYNRLAWGDGGYADIGKQYGIKINRAKLGVLFENNVSPDEWLFRAEILKKAKSSETYRQALGQVAKKQGQGDITRKEWFEWLGGATNVKVENIFEASTLLEQQGLDINAKQAIKAANQIGEPGEQIDVGQLVADIMQAKDFIGPELRNAGINDADLAVIQGGGRKDLIPVLEQIRRNRNAQVGLSLSSGTPQAAGGGLFPKLGASA